MKKIISMILLCAMLLSCFVGCATPNDPVDENLPGDEVDSTPNDTTDEKLPDNEIAPTPDDSVDEKDPDNVIDPTPDDTDEKDPDDEIDPTPDDTDEKDPGDEIDPTPDDNEDEENPDNEGNETEKNPDIENDSNAMELDEMFDILKEDAAVNNKIFFYTSREELFYELKESGLYENSRWQPSGFSISIKCNFENIADEDWYKQCSSTDTKSLNEAFYHSIASTLSKGEFINIPYKTGLRLSYTSAENLYCDYSSIKSLTDLDYVTIIEIGYLYGLPYDYMAE